MSVNKVILVGRLGRDPETRYTGGGQAVANFSVATDESYKDKNGERQKRTEWHRITAWGKLAEICQQYLKKGTMVYIEGRIQSRPAVVTTSRATPRLPTIPMVEPLLLAAALKSPTKIFPSRVAQSLLAVLF